MLRKFLDVLTVLFVPLYFFTLAAALTTGAIIFLAPGLGGAIAAFFCQPLAYVTATGLVLAYRFRAELAKVLQSGKAPFLVIPILLLALCGPALAQTAPAAAETTITSIVGDVLTGLILAVAAWVAHIIDKRTGLNTEASVRSIEIAHRDAIEKAATSAASMVTNLVASGIAKSEALTKAAGWMEGVVPEALGYFNLVGADLEQKIANKLTELFGIDPIVAPAPAPGAAAS